MNYVLVLLILLTQVYAYALVQEAPDIKSCLGAAVTETASLPSQSVLYVFDVDNTALALNQNIGSVHWFRWQQKLINDGITEDRVADTIPGLLDMQLKIYQLSKSHPPEPSIPDHLDQLQIRGYPVMYHTSRNADVRDITERELTNNKLLPLQQTIGPIGGYPGRFVYEHGPENQRPVSFQNGVYITSGQNKGVWLLFLLDKVGVSPKHVVFVDDEAKNLKDVEQALKGKIPTTLCRYGYMDKVVNAFNNSNKLSEIVLWREFAQILGKFN